MNLSTLDCDAETKSALRIILDDTTLSAQQQWQQISTNILHPGIPFSVHQQLYQSIYADCDERPYAWFPSQDDLQSSNAARVMQTHGIADIQDLLARGKEPAFQLQLLHEALGIQFATKPHAYCDASDPEQAQWLPGASLNIVESCFHADPDAIAICEQHNDEIREISYRQLQASVKQHVAAIQAAGLHIGDRIALAMPMHSDAIAVLLGIIASGCTAVLLAESFSADEMAVRCQICQPTLIFTQDIIIRGAKQLALYEKVRQASDAPCIVRAAEDQLHVDLKPQDQAYDVFLNTATTSESIKWTATDPHHHILILFSSGTTGTPKAIPWYQVMPIKSAMDAHIHHDIQSGNRVCWPTSLGWMMGPWLVFATLINKACVALSNAAPTTRAFGQFVQDAHIQILGLVPSMVRSWRQSQCMEGLDWTQIRAFSSTGECSHAEDMLYLMALANYKPIIEYCGGTETAGAYITGTRLKPHVPGTFNTPAFGFSWILLNEEQQRDRLGEVYFIAPVLGLSNELLNADHHQTYFADTPRLDQAPLLRRHGDQIEDLGDHYYRAHGRIDDTMNLGGIKVSAIEIETLLQQDPDVRELAAIEVPPPGGGPGRLIIYAVLETDRDEHDLLRQLQLRIREKLNPLFKIYKLVSIDALPRTASNKIMRRTLRSRFEQMEHKGSVTI